MPTFEEFLNDLKECGDDICIWFDQRAENPELSIRWTTGGMTGGSCWGGKVEYPVEAEPEPEFESLDKLLERYSPSITFLQYKRLMSYAVTKDDSDGGDYYGNYYNHTKKSIKLKDIYDYLTGQNLLTIPEPKDDWL